jgi:hypothetical protein
VPLMPAPDTIPSQSRPMTAAAFLRTTAATNFYSGGEAMPGPQENR